MIAQSVFLIAILDGSGFGILVAWLVVILAGRLVVICRLVGEIGGGSVGGNLGGTVGSGSD